MAIERNTHHLPPHTHTHPTPPFCLLFLTGTSSPCSPQFCWHNQGGSMGYPTALLSNYGLNNTAKQHLLLTDEMYWLEVRNVLHNPSFSPLWNTAFPIDSSQPTSFTQPPTPTLRATMACSNFCCTNILLTCNYVTASLLQTYNNSYLSHMPACML